MSTTTSTKPVMAILAIFGIAVVGVVALAIWGADSGSEPQPVEVVAGAPESCLLALDAADELQGLSAKVLVNFSQATDLAVEGMEAAWNQDPYVLSDIADDVRALSDDLVRINMDTEPALREYNEQSEACRGVGS